MMMVMCKCCDSFPSMDQDEQRIKTDTQKKYGYCIDCYNDVMNDIRDESDYDDDEGLVYAEWREWNHFHND